MNFFKKILLNGVFETMIDENIDKNARNIAWICVSFLYACVIVGLTILVIGFNESSGKLIFAILDGIAILLCLRLYIRLILHIIKINKIKKRKIVEKQLEREEELKKRKEEDVNQKYMT